MFSGRSLDLGGLLMWIAGIRILGGSQGWLRFVILMVVPAFFVGLVHLVGSACFRFPVEIGGEWTDHRDVAFWTLGVSPVAFFGGEGLLGVVAIRMRGIPFWTPAVKFAAVMLAVLALAGPGAKGVEWWRSRAPLPPDIAADLEEARDHAMTYGSRSSATSLASAGEKFGSSPRLVSVIWRGSPNASMTIHGKEVEEGGRKRTHAEWVRLPAGGWGKLELEWRERGGR